MPSKVAQLAIKKIVDGDNDRHAEWTATPLLPLYHVELFVSTSVGIVSEMLTIS